MDLQKIITDLLGKLKLDTSLLDKFKKNPLDTVKSLLGDGVSLDADQLKTVAEGITAKLGVDDVVKKSGFFAKIKSFFSKK